MKKNAIKLGVLIKAEKKMSKKYIFDLVFDLKLKILLLSFDIVDFFLEKDSSSTLRSGAKLSFLFPFFVTYLKILKVQMGRLTSVAPFSPL